MLSFERKSTSRIDGVIEIIPVKHSDQRGSFRRLFCEGELAEFGFPGKVKQANFSETAKAGTVRGLHCQKPPYRECKLIKCISGSVFDVVIDLRETSSTFLSVDSFVLSDHVENMLLVPEGVAHGFQTLVDDVKMIYFHSAVYSPEHENTINPSDPLFNIEWPLPFAFISKKDREAGYFVPEKKGFIR